ncbi:unnamed protein product [Nezara viridula]|uniref:Uncharacterized protein n=1 Tax=Nezara viridula TaxID=85310 RepID=A0A9P0E719_NEZVI|nr:unnamed protein product [Nezara viridula]
MTSMLIQRRFQGKKSGSDLIEATRLDELLHGT